MLAEKEINEKTYNEWVLRYEQTMQGQSQSKE
jgi:hypothetical protein